MSKGNGNLLENLFQEKLFVDQEAVEELQKLVLKNLHKGYLKHWYGYSTNLLKDMKNPTRTESYGLHKLLLNLFRVLHSGIILAQHREVVYHLPSQTKYCPGSEPLLILKKYLSDETLSEKDIEDANNRIAFLRDILANEIDKSHWSKRLSLDVFDEWLIDYYNRMRR